MGTTLTGTTPATTYDSLIKVTDNGPLSGSLKTLTDGLGNDSALALSTGAASVTGTLAVSSSVTAASLNISNTDGFLGAINSSAANGGYFEWRTSGTAIADIGTAQQIFGSGGNATLGINARGARDLVFGSNNTERIRITSAGKVGINTTSALGQLNIKNESAGATTNALALYNTPSNTENTGVAIEFYPNVGVDDRCARISSVNPTTTGTNLSDLRFFTSNNAAPTEKMRITHTGNVGIGTSTPSEKLEVDGNLQLGTTVDAKLYMLSTGGNGNNERFYIEGYAEGGTYGGGFKLYTRDDSNIFNNAVTVNRNGLVGIGTTAPTSLLNLSSATPILTLNQTIANSEQGIEFDNSDTNYAFIRANAQTGLITYAAGLTGGAGYVHRFIVDGSERLRITPDGLTFNGDTAAANALDDYEEGTFTPTLIGTTATGGTLAGNYTKIGRAVYINIRIESVTFSGSTGSANISGLPFTVVSGFLFYNFSCNYQNCVDGSSTGGFFIPTTTQLQFNDLATTTAATFVDGSSREIILSGFYFV
jgi:hypothetical protein